MIVAVRHNIEVAHRLWTIPGKCHRLHGHSMWVTLEVEAPVDADGITVEFGELKYRFRALLDGTLDHRTLLHRDDPLGEKIDGAFLMAGNPTTENLAAALAVALDETVRSLGGVVAGVKVEETAVNAAHWRP